MLAEIWSALTADMVQVSTVEEMEALTFTVQECMVKMRTTKIVLQEAHVTTALTLWEWL